MFPLSHFWQVKMQLPPLYSRCCIEITQILSVVSLLSLTENAEWTSCPASWLPYKHTGWPFSRHNGHSRLLKTQHWRVSGNIKTTQIWQKSRDKTLTCYCDSIVVSWMDGNSGFSWVVSATFVFCSQQYLPILSSLYFTSLLPRLGKRKSLAISFSAGWCRQFYILSGKSAIIPQKRALLSWLLLRTKAGLISDLQCARIAQRKTRNT